MTTVGKLQEELKTVKKQVAKTNHKMKTVNKKGSNPKRKGKRGLRPAPRRQGPRRNGGRRGGLSMSQPMQRFINCVIDPFGDNSNGAQVPDNWRGDSTIMKDYTGLIQPNNYSANSWTTGGLNGVLYFMVPGFVQSNTLYNPNYSNYPPTVSTTNYSYWHIATCGIGDEDFACPIDDAQIYYGINTTVNLPTIFNYADSASSLAQSTRITSIGLRIWPRIPYVTESNSITISKIVAGEMQLAAIFQDMLAFSGTQKSVEACVQSSERFKTYTNADGVTVRMNTLQDTFLTMKSQLTWSEERFLIDELMVPVVAVYFTQAIDGDPYTTGGLENCSVFTLPLFYQSIFWHEAQLQVPSPILPVTSPIDHNYLSVINMVLSAPGLFQVVTKGHTFKGLGQMISRFSRHAATFLDSSSKMLGNVGRVASYASGVFA
jgi:Ni/Co efflux regulator RcnB